MSERADQQAIYMNTKPLISFGGLAMRRTAFVVLVVALLSWGVTELRKPDTLPIKKIHAVGSFVKIDEGMLRTVIAQALDGGYFAVN